MCQKSCTFFSLVMSVWLVGPFKAEKQRILINRAFVRWHKLSCTVTLYITCLRRLAHQWSCATCFTFHTKLSLCVKCAWRNSHMYSFIFLHSLTRTLCCNCCSGFLNSVLCHSYYKSFNPRSCVLLREHGGSLLLKAGDLSSLLRSPRIPSCSPAACICLLC